MLRWAFGPTPTGRAGPDPSIGPKSADGEVTSVVTGQGCPRSIRASTKGRARSESGPLGAVDVAGDDSWLHPPSASTMATVRVHRRTRRQATTLGGREVLITDNMTPHNAFTFP